MAPPESVASMPAEPKAFARRFRLDRVGAVAVALIVVSVAWRAGLAARGWFSQDEFVLAAQALDARLDADFLLQTVNDSLMPGGLLTAWLMVRLAGFASWPWVLMLAVGQAAVGVAVYRLLRDLLRPGWGLLVPLALFLFSPLTLEVSSLWSVGLLVLPMQLALVLAVRAQVRYVRTGRLGHLATVALWLLFGLLFDPKALLIAPLLFLLTVFLFTDRSPWRSLVTVVRRHWRGWLLLTLLSGAYLAFYLTRPARALDQLTSPGQAFTFLGDLVGATVVPGLLGGPWRWTYAGDGPPLVDPYPVAMWLSWLVLATLVVVTVRRRRSAVRAWLLLACYVGLVAALFAVTHVGGVLGPMVGTVPRFVADVVPVAAICVGVALFGLRDDGERARFAARPLPGVPRALGSITVGRVVTIAVLVAVGTGAVWSTVRFGENWSTKHGREYLTTAQAELAAAPADTVFLDAVVPDRVVAGYFWPDNRQSHFFRPAERRPEFVEVAELPVTFDEEGRIRPVRIEGVTVLPGPVPDCGHRVESGQTTQIPLETRVEQWPHVVEFGYLSSGDATATMRLGEATREITVRRGLNQLYFPLPGAGETIEVTLSTPDVALCTRLITVGRVVPAS